MIKRVAGIFLLYLTLAIILTWPLAPLSWDHVINAGDPLFYAWNLMHNVSAITRGFGGLLDTNIFYPTTNTLALSDTLATQMLLAAPIIWLTNNPIFAVNIYTLLTFPIAGMGMYLLVRSFTRHEWASILTGAMFAFSIPRFGQLSHVPAISSQWFPFFIYGLYWFLASGKFRHLTVALISFLLLLGSTVYLGVFAVVVAIIMTGGFVFDWIKKHQITVLWHRLTTAMLPLTLTAVVSLVLMYPYIRLKAEHPEITRSLDESSARAAYQQDYGSVTNTSLLAGILKTNEGERALYPTVALLLLAAFGLFQWKKKNLRFTIALFSAVALIGLILSFGPERPFSIGPFDTGYITLPYTFLYKVFPLLQILRVPARFSIVFILGLSVLAGYGAACMRGSRLKKYEILAFAGMTILFLIEIWQMPLSLVKVPTYSDIPLVYQWLRQQSNVRAIIELPIGNIEEGNMPIQQQVRLPYEKTNEDAPLVSETYRVYFAGFHDKKTVNGYSGYVTQSYHDAVANLASFPGDASLGYLKSQGVTHIIVHPWQLNPEKRAQYIIDPNHPQLTTKFATLDGDIVYEIK